MSDSSMAAGWYEAPGDPPGTKRYWDGNQWTTDPMTDAQMAAQTGATAAPAAAAGAAPIGAAAGAAPVAGMSQWGELAPWGTRAVGLVIDWALFALVPYIAIFILGAVFGAISDALGALVIFVGYIAVFALFLYVLGYGVGTTGQSPGKRMMGIKIVGKETGQVIGGGAGIGRWFAHIIDSLVCYIGWLMPLWDSERQTIADKLIGTYAIIVPKGEIMPLLPDGKPF